MKKFICLLVFCVFAAGNAEAGPIISGGGEPDEDPGHIIEPDIRCQGDGLTLSLYGLSTGSATVYAGTQVWDAVPVTHTRECCPGESHGAGCGGDCEINGKDTYLLRWGGPFSGKELLLHFPQSNQSGEGTFSLENGSNEGDVVYHLHCGRNTSGAGEQRESGLSFKEVES